MRTSIEVAGCAAFAALSLAGCGEAPTKPTAPPQRWSRRRTWNRSTCAASRGNSDCGTAEIPLIKVDGVWLIDETEVSPEYVCS